MRSRSTRRPCRRSSRGVARDAPAPHTPLVPPRGTHAAGGTSHPRDRDLSSLPIPVVKIVATNDGVAADAQFDRRRLPASTTWVRIEGGNQAQFAYYAPYQLFDRRATIAHEAQQAQVIAALLDLARQEQLKRIE